MILKYMPVVGILSLFYFVILTLYIGFENDSSFIWVLLGILLIFLPRLNQLRIRWFGRAAVSQVIKWGFLTCAVLSVCVFIIVTAMIISGMAQKEQPGYAYIIILGARVQGEAPSHSLQMRLDKAYSYLAENPETRAVLSGARGMGEDITEAECMRRYLVSKGIDESRMILEEKSTSTHENLKYSAGKIGDIQSSIGIISNNFHIFRAVKLAEKLGYTNVDGIAANIKPILLPHYIMREVVVIVKDKIVGNI